MKKYNLSIIMNDYKNINMITAASFEKYLLFKNWVRDYNFPNKKMMVFHEGEKTIAVPSSEKLLDFYMVLSTMLEQLSDLYQLSINDLIKEITSSYSEE